MMVNNYYSYSVTGWIPSWLHFGHPWLFQFGQSIPTGQWEMCRGENSV